MPPTTLFQRALQNKKNTALVSMSENHSSNHHQVGRWTFPCFILPPHSFHTNLINSKRRTCSEKKKITNFKQNFPGVGFDLTSCSKWVLFFSLQLSIFKLGHSSLIRNGFGQFQMRQGKKTQLHQCIQRDYFFSLSMLQHTSVIDLFGLVLNLWISLAPTIPGSKRLFPLD